MIIRFLLVIFLSANILIAQTVGEWRNFTNKSDVQKIINNDNSIWAATSGGIYSTDLNGFNHMLTKSEGLSSQTITAIAADDENRIWLGTAEGIINIYNIETGDIQKIFDINRTDNARKAINNIYIKDNSAYIAIDFGLSIINTESLEFVETVLKFGDFPSNSKVNSIRLSDVIYTATENGLAIQKQNISNLSNPDSWNSTFKGIESGNIPAGDILNSVVYLNELYVGTDQGLFVKNNNNNWNKVINITLPVNDLVINDDKLLILFSNALYEFNSGSFNQLYSADEIELRDLLILNESDFYIASSSGIIELNSSGENIISPNGPITNNLISVAVDDNSNLWAATGKDGKGKGFIQYNQTEWINHNKSADTILTTNDYHEVFAEEDDVLLCTWGFGFSIINNNNFSHYDAKNTIMEGISDNHNFIVIMALRYDNSNNLWAFNHWTYNRGCLFALTEDGEQYSYQFPYFDFSKNVFIDNGEVDDYNTKWFSIHNNGLFYFNENGTLDNTDDDVWGRLPQTEYFNSRDITCLAVDNRNELWVGTSLGIKIIPDPSVPKGTMLNVFPLRQQSINCIAVDPLNQKWVGTSQGLFHVTSDGSGLLAQYDSKNSPLPSDNIQSVAIDKRTGTVYISTAFGLSSLTTTSVEPNEDYSNLFVYPNPFVIDGTPDDYLQVDGLVANSSLKILTISGKLVKEYETAGGRIDFWDGKDMEGKYVPSGIYIIVAFDQEANKVQTAKVAVVRK